MSAKNYTPWGTESIYQYCDKSESVFFFFNFDPGMALANTLAVNVHTGAEKRSQGNDLWCKQIFHHDSW